MSEPLESKALLDTLAGIRGRPDEVPILSEIARRNGDAWRHRRPAGNLADADRGAAGELQGRLQQLLLAAQQDLEGILAGVDQRQALPATAAGAASGSAATAGPLDELSPLTPLTPLTPLNAATAAGAYLSALPSPNPPPVTAAAMAEPPAGVHAAAIAAPASGAAGEQRAAMERIALHVVEIQRALSLL